MNTLEHELTGRIVVLNPNIGEWWEERCYDHYAYRVLRVVNPWGKTPLAHLDIVMKLPGKEGSIIIEHECQSGDTVNVYTKDLIILEDIKNSSMKMLLEKE